MIEYFTYTMMNLLGYRKYYFDVAFIIGINLDRYEGWLWRPWDKKGTYREKLTGFEYSGYGIDK